MDAVTIAKNKITERVSLQDFIGQFVRLQRKGGRYFGLCPFHNEKTPSFTVFDDRYYCFGCKANGDAIEFARKHLGMNFFEAIEFIANKFSIEIPNLKADLNPEQKKIESKKTLYYKISDHAKQLYSACLMSPYGENVRRYLHDRGIHDDLVKKMQLGYAPPERNFLSKRLISKGVAGEDLQEVSLASVKGEKVYDFFRDRLMIPIFDSLGRPVAFGGRILGDGMPKYLNSRETPIFSKSKTLYGFNVNKEAIREAGKAIVVEGYMDCIQLMQFNINNVVACLGTALTKNHLQLLKTKASEIYLVFDGDSAGQKAMLSSLKSAMEFPDLKVMAVTLPEGEDPDSYVKQNGVEAFSKLLSSSKELLEFAVEAEFRNVSSSAIPGMVESKLIPWLKEIKDPLKVGYLAAKIAEYSSIPQDLIISAAQGRGGISSHSVADKRGSFTPQNSQRTSARGLALTPNRGGGQAHVSIDMSRWDYELLGHLFFARPDDIDLNQVTTESIDDCVSADNWRDLALLFVKQLKSGYSPHEVFNENGFTMLTESQHQVIEKILKAEVAFKTTDRSNSLNKLMSSIKLQGLRDTLKVLKSELNKGDIEPEAEIGLNVLEKIQDLNREILALERQLGR